ncbi:hypothetical protein ABW21_db0202919 [Orbilia brochopaga]|nr:hypothetical protein ABW21_db0202919 [Drechslerella brochopaga]
MGIPTSSLEGLDPQDQATLRNFESQSSRLKKAIDEDQQQLMTTVEGDHRRILTDIAVVFTRLKVIATFINGDYDSRRQEQSVRDEFASLAGTLDSASNALVATADSSEQAIEHTKLKLVVKRDLEQLRADFEDYRQTVGLKFMGAQRDRNDANMELRECRSNLDAAESGLRDAQARLSNAERDLVNSRTGDVDQQRRKCQVAQEAYGTAHGKCSNINDSMDKWDQARDIADKYSDAVPEAKTKLEELLSEAENIRQTVSNLQSSFKELSLQVGKIKDETRNTDSSNAKERIIDHLLSAIDHGLVDISLVDQTRGIIQELKTGEHEGLISKANIAAAFARIEYKMGAIGPINWQIKLKA